MLYTFRHLDCLWDLYYEYCFCSGMWWWSYLYMSTALPPARGLPFSHQSAILHIHSSPFSHQHLPNMHARLPQSPCSMLCTLRPTLIFIPMASRPEGKQRGLENWAYFHSSQDLPKMSTKLPVIAARHSTIPQCSLWWVKSKVPSLTPSEIYMFWDFSHTLLLYIISLYPYHHIHNAIVPYLLP